MSVLIKKNLVAAFGAVAVGARAQVIKT